MRLPEFIRERGELDFVPIDVDGHLIPILTGLDIVDEIFHFWDPELDIRTLRGYHVREDDIPDGEGGFLRHITVGYGRGSNEMQRLVCCKELLHILDPEGCKTATKPEVSGLISKIALPPQLIDATDGAHALTDRMATLLALAVLFPLKAREILYPAYIAEKITLERIADDAELPPEYVAVVLHEEWPKMLGGILTAVNYLQESKR